MDGSIQKQIYGHAISHFGSRDIAFIGDSITEGGYVWANKIGVYNLNVWNYGKGGFTTEQIGFYAKKVAREGFKFCFIMSGRNDEIDSRSKVKESYNDYVGILEALMTSNVEPIVTLMLYRENETKKKFIDEFNNEILKYCIEHNITVIDLNKLLCDQNGLKKEYSRDGTHINEKAYEIWGKEINRVLHDKNYLH